MTVLTTLTLATLALASVGGQGPREFRFSKTDAGKVPAGWKSAQTNEGKEASVWRVVADSTALSKSGHVLAQIAEAPRQVYNLCVAEGTRYKHVEVSVHFKAVKGKVDQGGGVVWRYQDADNYYVARMNPLEDNYRVYKVVGGKRIQLETTADELKVETGTWHKLTIRHVGDKIECFLDGKKVLDAKDNSIPKAGQIGLWAKADAHTCFDVLTVREVETKD